MTELDSQQQLVASVARGVVTQVAPHETPLFRANSAAYFGARSSPKAAGRGDDMLGFGSGKQVTILTPAILALADAVVQQLVREAEQSGALPGEAVQRVQALFQGGGATLTPAQAEAIRRVCLERAQALKLPDEQAGQLVQSLLRQMGVSH